MPGVKNSRGALLVTRPPGQAGALCAELSARGFTPYEQPLLELFKLPKLLPEARRYIENLSQYQHLIFISGNAVRFGMENILPLWPQLPDGIKVYAIGSSTAGMLREYGIEAICTASAAGVNSAMTSESLLAMEPLQGVEGQHVLIVKGLGGRAVLSEVLAGRGALVDNLACYQRQCPVLATGELAEKIAGWKIDLILISSGEGLANMLTLLSPAETIKLCTVPLIVPSGRVARMAEDVGFSAVHTAENASNAAMIEMVEHCSPTSEKKP